MEMSNSRKAAIFCELFRFGTDIFEELMEKGSTINAAHPELSFDDIIHLSDLTISEKYLANYLPEVRDMFHSGLGAWEPVADFISDSSLDTVFASVYRQYLINTCENSGANTVKEKRPVKLEAMSSFA